jgi:heat shock protein HtpX
MTLFAILAILLVIASYVFVIVLAAACVYLPVLMNAVLLELFGIALAGGLLWSLVPRTDKFEPPGPQLRREQHPRLFAELDAIAASLNEALPSEVYLIGEVNAWVADRGGVMGFGSRRVMGIGLPLLSVLTVAQFRAVLAHEFAHYYGGDTSLGPWVYKTKMAMVRTFRTMGSMGQLARFWALVIMYLVVTTILKGYFTVFMRAIHLISRKQEYRADELACLVAGKQPLIDGLRTIHGTAPAWKFYWNNDVAPIVGSGSLPALGDGFARFVAAPGIWQRISENVNKEISEGKVSPYDTHPPLRERIAAAERVDRDPHPISSQQNDNEPASILLDNPQAAELSFIYALNPSLQQGSLQCVAWDQVAASVTIPGWKAFTKEYGSALEGTTAGTIADGLPKLPAIGAQMRDPKGMLLTPAQRTQRAGQLLSAGLALALLDEGWDLHVAPGVFNFQKGTEQLNPFLVVQQLMEGKLTRDEWAKRCAELGLTEIALFPAQPKMVSST